MRGPVRRGFLASAAPLGYRSGMAKIFEERQTLVRAQVGIRCDRCGVTHDTNDVWEAQEYLSWSMLCGYGNRVFGDLKAVAIDLCQDCTKEVLGPWIRVNNYGIGGAIPDDEGEEAEQD